MAGSLNLIHTATLLPPYQSDTSIVASVKAVCWSNNKVATTRSDNVIQLYDEKGCPRDKFLSRSRDSKDKRTGYQVTSMVFSPDGYSLAVGQSDGIVFVYRIGEFKGKKTISNKFPQPFSVTAVEWPNDDQLFIGLLDGKIRLSNQPDRKTTSKVTLVFDGESPVIRLIGNSAGTELAASFMDGKIVLFTIGEALATTLKLSIKHARPATALCIGPEALVAGGSDQRLIIYETKSGKVLQIFDYSKGGNRNLDMAWAAMNSVGNVFVTASSSKLKVFTCNTRTKKWEEGKEKQCPQIYNPTCLALRGDGSYLSVGSCAGSCELFELVYKRTKRQKIDLNYISPSHVIVSIYATNQRVVLKSKYHNEIIDVKVMGKDRYVIAKTTETMFVSDLDEDLTSEVLWPATDDSERFHFTPVVCMIFSHGELSLLEYGRDEILGTYRTSIVNPNVISVRINERISSSQMVDGSQNKRMAYLLDYKTIQIVDLEFVLTLGTVIHEHKIDWLQLNETGAKLLYRDRRMTLTLVDVSSMEKFILDRSCGFAQWVPGCDVIVCQSEKQLRIWYNMDAPEISVDQDVHGIATEIIRENDQSVVMIKDGGKFVPIPLDENRIQFSAALEQGNLSRATYFLEESRSGPDMPSLWVKLGKTAALECELRIALRSFAAVDDVPKTKFLEALIKRNSSNCGSKYEEKRFWKSDYWTKANMHLLLGDVKQAVTILFNNDDVDAAIDLYSSLHEFDTVMELIKTKRHPNESLILQNFVMEWYNNDQYDLLGEMAERSGKPDVAICFYLEAGYPNKAAPCALQNPATLRNQELVQALTESLLQKNFVEDAGNIYEASGHYAKALKCFRHGRLYDKAVHLARNYFQYEVVPLEEEWGDYLMSLKQFDAASNHFIEAGLTLKALDALFEAGQFKKAAQIIETLETTEAVSKYCLKIGEYFKDNLNYSQAEKCFIRGGAHKKAIEMYNDQGQWGEAYRIASDFSDEARDELHQEYMKQVKAFQVQGKLGCAEKLLLAIDETDLAISMYAKAKQYDDVLRLVEDHHPEHTTDTKIHLAEVLIGEENFKGAEKQFLKANMWERAMAMYEGRKMWEDAVRVAKNHGGINAFRQAIFRWSRSMPIDTAVKLLDSYSFLDDCIIYHCQQSDFQAAETLAEAAAPEKLPDVHLAWAIFLVERNIFLEAKIHYLKANKPREAIDMLINANELQEAIATADEYAKEELPRVLVMYAKELFAQKDFNAFESVMIRAEKVVQVIETYKSNEMWAEALQFCQQHVPTMYNQLNEEYTAYRSAPVTKPPMIIIREAKEFEISGDYRRAIDRYLQLSLECLNDANLLRRSWIRATELAKKFLPRPQAICVLKEVGKMLDGIKCYADAATMHYQANMQEEALHSWVKGGIWDEAMQVAQKLGPEQEEFVRQKKAETFRGRGKTETLEDHGEESLEVKLDVLCKTYQWEQCLERAKSNDELFSKYLAKYVTHICKTRSPQHALNIYAVEYGPLIHKQHLNLYRAMASLIINNVAQDEFEIWSKFRDVFLGVCNGLASAGLDRSSKTLILMENYLWVMHLLATKSAFKSFPGLEQLAAKISMSLLRFTKIVNPERAFYEAGSLCKQVKWDSNAFVFFNFYLDIHDAVLAGARTTGNLDHSDLMKTDIPRNVDLFTRAIVPTGWHDKVKDWVLALSMDSSVRQELRTDERGIFEGSLQDPQGCSKVCEPCVLTGFPVFTSRVTFRSTDMYANKDDWNRFLISCRGEQNDPRLKNILQFIEKWAGPDPSYY